MTADKLDSALNAEIDGKQDKNMGAGHESHIVTTDETGTITSVAAIEQTQVTGLTDALADKANTADIPTAVSELTNDSGYLTNADMTGYAKTTDLDAKQNKNIGADHSGKILTVGADGNIVDGLDTALAAKANTADIPTAVSELTNDSGYLTNADMTGYAKTTDLDAKQNKNIGADHSGKILTVGADGNIGKGCWINRRPGCQG